MRLADPNLRVVIDCVTFETVKIVDSAKHYKADKVYLFHKAEGEPYSDFLEKVQNELDKNDIRYKSIKAEINDFSKIFRKLISTIEKERKRGNHVYVNVSAGPHVFCSAGLIACMMKGGNPFYASTEKYTVQKEVYYEEGEPIGLAKEVDEPEEILCFNLPTPNTKIVKGLRVWKREKDRGNIMSASNIIEKLSKENLMNDIYEDNREKVSQKATMKYRRNFLEKWLEKGWIKKEERGEYEMTEDGKRILDVFG